MSSIDPTTAPAASLRVPVKVVGGDAEDDLVTIEEPLEIRLVYGAEAAREELSLSVTMRTPGNDIELALGFLVGEAIVHSAGDIVDAAPCGPPSPDKGLTNVIKVELSPDCRFDAELLTRHTFTTSSCGVCGKASLDAVRVATPSHGPSGFTVGASVLHRLPAALRKHQTEFARTGGLHAAATFTSGGRIERAREDVGRHNALDKLIGAYFGRVESTTLRDRGLLLSGRARFELVQKAAVAGITTVAAIGPPSSLAIELAADHDMTLVGFLKADRFNLYTGTRATTP